MRYLSFSETGSERFLDPLFQLWKFTINCTKQLEGIIYMVRILVESSFERNKWLSHMNFLQEETWLVVRRGQCSRVLKHGKL